MKKVTVLMMVALMLALCSCGSGSKTSDVKDVSVQSDYIRYEYSPLKESSEIIVRAEVQDDLSEKNSMIERDSDDPESVSDFSAVREIKVTDVYYGEEAIRAGDVIKVIEDAAIDREFYYHGENYESLKNGKEYILFLNKDNAAGEYSIISADNGKVCISDFKELNNADEENFEIAIKALAEYDSKLSDEEKANIIKSKIIKGDRKSSLQKEMQLSSGVLKYDYVDDSVAVTLP